MTVQSNQYLIYGAKLDFETYGSDDQYQLFEKFMDSAFDDKMNPNGLHCLFDGMNGQYVIIGRCIAKSSEGQGLANMQINSIDPDISDLARDFISVELGIDVEIALHLITHYR